MKERPILFSGAMVRAILAGTKTQTRRICKLDVRSNGSMPAKGSSYIPCLCDYLPPSELMIRDPKYHEWQGFCEGGESFCPYGQPGGQLWVREPMRRIGSVVRDDGRPVSIDIRYEADGATRLGVPFPDRIKGIPKHGQCLAYGGYCEASRITLEVTGVRVERLQDISEADAIAEGVYKCPSGRWEAPLVTAKAGAICFEVDDPRIAYRALWEQINGPGSWDANPWVWVVEFKRVAA